jgi:hypothetical protein
LVGYYNAIRVHDGWAAILKPNPFRVLAYMALRARDEDADPWFGLGHEHLAIKVLGLKMSERTTPKGQKDYDVQLRRVRRAITQLINEKAIETRDHATYGLQGTSHVVYRLFLDGPRQQSPMGLIELPAGHLPALTGTPGPLG